MNKKLLYLVIIGALFFVGCGTPQQTTNEDLPQEIQQKNDTEAMMKRDQTRIQNLHDLTYYLAKYQQKYHKYPEANDSWCAKNLIELFRKEFSAKEVIDPAVQKIEGLECPDSGIYYFFRDNNPDYYTFAIKLENDYLGNSYSPPQEIAKMPLENLKEIRQSPDGIRGNYYYIIGNFPVNLLSSTTK